MKKGRPIAVPFYNPEKKTNAEKMEPSAETSSVSVYDFFNIKK